MAASVDIVILAAGLGTRMKSKMAKVLHRAGGRTLIEHVVSTSLEVAPANRVVVVVGHQTDKVRVALGDSGVRFAEQTEQRGTGHAVMVCRDALGSDGGLLVVLYGDCPLLSAATIRELIEQQRSSTYAATVITTTVDDPTGYGRVIVGEDRTIHAIVEQKAAAPQQLAIREINSGIYCFRSDLLWKHIGEIGTNNPAGEYYLTDMVEILRRQGHSVGRKHLDHPDEVLGINTRAELGEVDRIFRRRTIERLMRDGVTIEKPETVTIDSDVRIGTDTIIGPFAQVLAGTVIGEDCRVGACSIVASSTLADGVEVMPFTIIEKSRVGAGAHIGPYARLRMNNEIGAGAHIGNFVELKKTRLGAGAKSNHLAYLGDSVIGEKVNIGAGTITCNYDGEKKHQTAIGDGAFIGSNSTLVAPVEIGAGSYVGAGSVVTDPVPADALAVGRGRQVNKDGWAKKRRQSRDRKEAG